MQDFFGSRSIKIAIIGVLTVLAIFLLAETITVVQNFDRSGVPATDTIIVNGNGQAMMPPDIARISFTVKNTSATVADAQQTTTKQTNTALDFVKKQGIASKDIKTLSYNISPQYSYGTPCLNKTCPSYRGTPKITGYNVSESIQVTVHTLSKVGELLGGLGNLSVQNISGPSFTLADPTAGYNAARADAISKAKAQATLLAKQLGVHLGKLVNFSESSGGYRYPTAYGLGVTSSKLASTPLIPTGENTYRSSVSLTYEIR